MKILDSLLLDYKALQITARRKLIGTKEALEWFTIGG